MDKPELVPAELGRRISPLEPIRTLAFRVV